MEELFSRLEGLSAQLNESSDSLTYTINEVEKKLASLRLGVAAFAPEPLDVVRWKNSKGQEITYNYCLAYAKTDGNWGLVIWRSDEEGNVCEEIPLQEASRERRVKAMYKLPALITQLEGKAEDALLEIEKALQASKKV